MDLRQRQDHKLLQRQELRLTHQLIQRLELLHLPTLEVEQLVNQEMEQNPLLEVQEQTGSDDTSSKEDDQRSDDKGMSESDELALLNRFDDDGGLGKSLKSSISSRKEASDRYQEVMQNVIEDEITLIEHLKSQIGIIDIPADLRMICEYTIDSIDDDGYIKGTLEDIADQIIADGEFSEITRDELVSKVEYALCSIIQRLDPPGVGARTLKECLLLQIGEDVTNYKFKQRLISEYFEELMHNKIPHVAKSLIKNEDFLKTYNLSPYSSYTDAVKIITQLKDELKSISPFPGILYSSRKTQMVKPDIIVKEMTPYRYEVILSDESIPYFVVNKRYQRLLRDKSTPKQQKDFIKKKLLNAKALIDAIGFRRWFMLKLAQYVVDYQKDFLEKGIESLRPLKMKDLATKFGVNISTISRAVNEKYIQTPHGIFPLKFFFATAATRSINHNPYVIQQDEGEKRSRTSIKDVINSIMSDEDKSRPLDDSQIAKILETQHGIKTARRTVAKYRNELDIPSARLRRVYTDL